MSEEFILPLMIVLFLGFGYLGVPVAFALLGGTLVGATFTDVTLPAIIQQMFNGSIPRRCSLCRSSCWLAS